MSDTDGTFNFLISMIYTQMFNLLCEKADDVYGGRLPVHVRCLIDEAANIGQIPNLEKLVATIRSREISACLVLQAKSQLKAIYKDNADTIIGNMDSQIFLGGTEQTTLKDLNAILGKETIDMYNTGQSKGSQESYNMNYQKLGKDLMTMDELAVMDGSKCIVQVRGVRPFNEVIVRQTDHCKSMLVAKGAEYAPRAVKNTAVDRLAHFKKAAVVMNTTPKAALMGMLSKHLISVSDMCMDERKYSKEQWDEKITDSINYFLILRAIVEEELNEED